MNDKSIEKSALVQKRGRVKGTLTRLKAFADSITDTTPLEDIVIRLNKAEELWAEFQAIEDVLLLIDDQISEIVEYEEKYFQIKSLLTRAINARNSRGSNENVFPDQLNSTMDQLLTQQRSFFQSFERNHSQTSARLPKLNIPYFSGEYREWTSFKDLFESSVHSNTSLSGSQKLQFLKGLLRGNAASVIRHLSISDANYNEAWNKLKSRFDKKFHITTALIKTFLDHGSLSQPSFKQLRSLYDTFDEVMRGLKALGSAAESRDPWLVYIGLTKLDGETRELWSQEIADKEYPSFQDFLDFLSKRCDALETCSAITRRNQTVKSFHTATTKTQPMCPKCGLEHPLFRCIQFTSDSVKNRKAFVVEKSLCFKCLGSNHSVKSCHSKIRCTSCKGNHHPLLHLSCNLNKAESHFLQSEEAGSSSVASSTMSSSTKTTMGYFEPSINSIQTSINPIQTPINPKQTPINPSQAPNVIQTPTSVDVSHQKVLSSLNTCVQDRKLLVPDNNSPSLQISLLPTALGRILDSQGKLQPCRVLLDSGSQVSLISESCAQRLALKRQNARLSITGLQSSGAGITRGKVALDVFSCWDNSNLKMEAFVMNKLTSLIPSEPFQVSNWKCITSLQLADPNFNSPSPIDVIIGADHFFEVLQTEKLLNENGQPFAQKTIFGWILFGKSPSNQTSLLNFHTKIIMNLDEILQRFWETEEIPRDRAMLTEEEKQCELHFINNFSRDEHGRYIVSLPFKTNTQPLGESKANAIKRLHAMERRFIRDPSFKEKYVNFMKEYERLGHMKVIPNEDVEVDIEKSYYLPHHAVFKHGPTPKIRVVFDGSCKSTTNISLNERLMVGPTIQRDLVAILLNFRKHRIAFSADIQKMYRQVLVKPADRDFQRIVWRERESSPIQHFKLRTVTYGTASAPFLATRVLHQLGEDHKSSFPQAATIIATNFYVDDLLSGCSSLPEAIKLRTELTQILQSGGFHLTKWHSNSIELLKGGQDETETSGCISIDDDLEVPKVLGVLWNSQEDIFTFAVSPITSDRVSKRTILSESSKIFDPLGWLSPFVITIKILLQQLWLSKYDWDDELPNQIISKWERIKTQLPALAKIKIPRPIQIHPTCRQVQLHGFSDASEAAYSAVVYCRSVNEAGNVVIRIVASKTKVAPLKQVSLPRLELCGALLLARLLQKVKQAMFPEDISVQAWTDSTIVLAWLSDVPRIWKTYIANRTAEILELIPRSRWRHVSSKDNPADLASRGMLPEELPDLDLWWNGPYWLSKNSSMWPSNNPSGDHHEVRKEAKTKNVLTCVQEATPDYFLEITSRFSSFNKLIRVLAYCLRFSHNCTVSKSNRRGGYLSANELNDATIVCIKCVQQSTFSAEIKELSQKKHIPLKSSILNLSPFIDELGTLRVGGRLQRSCCNYNAKHPIILPKSHHVTEILLAEAHRTYLHPGTSLLIGIIRQKYWVIGIRNLARKISRKCVSCFRQRATKTSQLMGSLPESRVTVSRAFFKVGVDYAGPLALHTKVGRGSRPLKGYIALFICLSTKAIHLELVSSLSAEAFVAALRRFVSRRGIPTEIISDNGTNFIGGKRILTELHELAMSSNKNELISYFLSQNRISWKCIPPGAPHFGGLWEAGVKSVKWHLRRVVGESILTFEEMTTLLHQVEAILNSRPYGALSSDPDDLDALTPSHFLIGEPLTTLPDPDISEVKLSRLGRWQHIQSMVQGFWKRWRLEYLASLQERPKWRSEQDSLKEGELVIISEDNLPPSKWLLGRVAATSPGEDGLVRVVTVRTHRGVYKRAINKIFKLPID